MIIYSRGTDQLLLQKAIILYNTNFGKYSECVFQVFKILGGPKGLPFLDCNGTFHTVCIEKMSLLQQ